MEFQTTGYLTSRDGLKLFYGIEKKEENKKV